MTSVEDCEELKCEKDGYFDIDAMKPYSSIWVSTRRDVRTKSHQQDDDTESKKNVTPSRACNNLHSLLETTEGCLSKEPSEDEIHNQVQQLSATKSDHFPLNPYKIFEKADSVSIRKISDRIIESMCKSESKPVFSDSEQINIKRGGGWSKEKQLSEKGPDLDLEEDHFKDAGDRTDIEDSNSASLKKIQKNENLQSKEKVNREPSRSSHLGGGDPQEEPLNKNKLLTENGKLVTEMKLTALRLKDHTGREYPVTVKYVWETDPNEILNAQNTINSSSDFVKIVDLISSLDSKPTKKQVLTPTIIVKTQQWQERSKSHSICSQNRNKRMESLTGEDKDTDGSNLIHGSKGDASSVRKIPIKETPSLRNALLRSKVSIVAPYQEKKIVETINVEGKDLKIAETNRECSKSNMSDKRSIIERKNRIPVKKKFPTVDELRMSNTLARPATFNRRELAPRPTQNRPPSAPTRELSSRIPQRISMHESGDKLPQTFNKRSFAGKFQAPNPAASNKFWK